MPFPGGKEGLPPEGSSGEESKKSDRKLSRAIFDTREKARGQGKGRTSFSTRRKRVGQRRQVRGKGKSGATHHPKQARRLGGLAGERKTLRVKKREGKRRDGKTLLRKDGSSAHVYEPACKP